VPVVKVTDDEIEQYRLAPSGQGQHAAVWADKPHRVVYDVVAIARDALGHIHELEAKLAAVREYVEDDSFDSFYRKHLLAILDK
jgi:hypothetical protein